MTEEIKEEEINSILPDVINEDRTFIPKKQINWDFFEYLCSIQCSQVEIAGKLRIDADTLRARVLEHYKEPYSVMRDRFSEGGKATLRQVQFGWTKKSAAMAMWLGKQWLGQKDTEHAIQVTPEMIDNNKKLIEQITRMQQEHSEKSA